MKMSEVSILSRLLLGVAIALWPGLAVQAAPAPASTPLASSQLSAQDFMQQVTTQLLHRLVTERPAYTKDPAQLFRIVDENITPYVDYPTIARRVMGRFYRQASDAQRQKFVAQFKDSLIRTYGNGLASYDHERISVLPARTATAANAATATVDMLITMNSGQNVPVTYELQRAANGAWMLENVVLNGINLGLTFRNQFASDVEQYHNNLDQVIAHWLPHAQAVTAGQHS